MPLAGMASDELLHIGIEFATGLTGGIKELDQYDARFSRSRAEAYPPCILWTQAPRTISSRLQKSGGRAEDMSNDQNKVTASVEVDQNQLAEGVRLLARHVKPRKSAKALVRKDAGDLVIEIGGGEIRSAANGRWEGRARLNGLLLLNAAKGHSTKESITIRVESGRLSISGSSIPCEWESTTAPTVLIPIGATLFDVLVAGGNNSDEALERSGHLETVQDARKKRKRLVRKAVKILQPLKVTENDIDALVDQQLSAVTSPRQ
jgi:hypothetical protein